MPTASPRRTDKTPEGPPRPSEHRYKVQHGVIVICEGERDQRDLYERLREQGLRVRVVKGLRMTSSLRRRGEFGL